MQESSASSPIPTSEQASPVAAGLVLLGREASPSVPAARNPRKGLKRFSNKVRTGCITCKIRRVKCDEAKPACMRCKKTGRVCDGYQLDAPDASLVSTVVAGGPHKRIAPGVSLVQHGCPLLTNSDWTPSEKRALDFYLRLSVPSLFSGVTGSFWGRVIPALCQQEPAIRHAVFAVSSLHESLFYGGNRIAQPKSDYFAGVQYGKALRSLQSWQFPQEKNLIGTASVVLPLVACALFICIEFMQGNSAAALIHISQGRRILARLDPSALASPAAELMRREITPIFSKLTVAAFMFGAAPEPIPSPFRWTNRRAVGGLEFANLAEAEQAIFEIVDDGLRFAKDARFWQHTSGYVSPDGPPNEELVALQDRRDRLLAQNKNWCVAFAALQAQTPEPLSEVAMVYSRTANVIVGMALDRREMCYDDYTTEFASIIILSKKILDEEDAKTAGIGQNVTRTTVFTFDSGLIPPLYFTALKSRHPGIRRDAVTLLKQHSTGCHRENLWDSKQAYKVAERMVALEEFRGWKILDTFDPDSPPWSSRKHSLHKKQKGEIAVDWMPSLFDQNGELKEQSDAHQLRIQPERRPILGYDGSELTDNLPAFTDATTTPRDFSELRGFFYDNPRPIRPALAEEAWAALTTSSPLQFHGSPAGGGDMATWWASIYDVPVTLRVPQEARIHNAIIDPNIDGGSWTSFFVEPDPIDPARVGVLREFIPLD